MVSVDNESPIEQQHADSLESEVDSEAVAAEKPKETEIGTELNDGNWDPLLNDSSQMKGDTLEDIEEEEGKLANSNGRLEDRVEAVPSGTKRASQHRLDLKLTSPPPWELIDPPSDDGQKETSGVYARNHRPLIPKSTYYRGPPTGDSAYGTAPVGHLGIHHPREVLRVERDYSGGDVIQFSPSYPLELEGRITPTQFLESINMINEVLISAHSLQHSVLDTTLAVLTLQLSRLVLRTHYDQELQRLQRIIDDLNTGLWNPVGMNILWPANVGFLFLEIEYYVSRFFFQFFWGCERLYSERCVSPIREAVVEGI